MALVGVQVLEDATEETVSNRRIHTEETVTVKSTNLRKIGKWVSCIFLRSLWGIGDWLLFCGWCSHLPTKNQQIACPLLSPSPKLNQRWIGITGIPILKSKYLLILIEGENGNFHLFIYLFSDEQERQSQGLWYDKQP